MSIGVGNGLINSPGILTSPVFPHASSSCVIKFWYIKYGTSSALNVSLYSNGNRDAVVFRLNNAANMVAWAESKIYLG
jgi:hypothetical protein